MNICVAPINNLLGFFTDLILQETEEKKRRLVETRQKKRRLLAEVRYQILFQHASFIVEIFNLVLEW